MTVPSFGRPLWPLTGGSYSTCIPSMCSWQQPKWPCSNGSLMVPFLGSKVCNDFLLHFFPQHTSLSITLNILLLSISPIRMQERLLFCPVHHSVPRAYNGVRCRVSAQYIFVEWINEQLQTQTKTRRKEACWAFCFLFSSTEWNKRSLLSLQHPWHLFLPSGQLSTVLMERVIGRQSVVSFMRPLHRGVLVAFEIHLSIWWLSIETSTT